MQPELLTPLPILAREQHGVASLAQLRALGWSRQRVRTAVAHGLLVPVTRGVYAVGHQPLGARTLWMAAVLALGPGAVLSHISAAMLWGLLAVRQVRPHVTTPRHAQSRDALVVHRTRNLSGADHTKRDDIPVTAVPRTAIDLGDVLKPAAYAQAIERVPLLDVHAFERALKRHPGRHATPALTRLIQLYGDHTRSFLERAFLTLIRRHHLPEPRVNRRVDGHERDFTWPDHNLVIEVDGGAFHASRERRAADNRRDLELTLGRRHHHRVTYEQVVLDPAGTAHTVRALLTLG
jgi:predicted transcriptional regulator of viral defense system